MGVQMREVAVIGVGMHRFGRFPEEDWTELGRVAIVEALKYAGIGWEKIEAAFCGNTYGDVAAGHNVVAQVGLTGIPIVNVENACSSGGSAFRLAYHQVAAGIYDIVIAFGFEKIPRGLIASTAFPQWQREIGLATPPVRYALEARRHMEEYGTKVEHFAMVSVKNHKNGCYNKYAHYQQEVTIEEVLNSRMIVDPLTLLMCCPNSEGGAAAILCSKKKAMQYTAKPVTVAAAALVSDMYTSPRRQSPSIIERAAQAAWEQSGYGPKDMDLLEVHEAMASAEIVRCEEIGICNKGEYTKLLERGETEIKGRIPVNVSGGLLAKGHPLGATSLAQVSEIVWQLNEQAGQRQVKGAKIGLTLTTGAGPNCCVIILKK